MYDKMNAQLQQSLKPFSELAAINVKTFQTLAEQQSKYFTAALSDSVAYTQSLTSQKDLAGVWEVQKDYGTSIQGRMTEAAKDAYLVVSQAQEKATDIVKSAFAKVQEQVQENVQQATNIKPVASKVKVAKK